MKRGSRSPVERESRRTVIKRRRFNPKNAVVICIFLFYISNNSFWAYRLMHSDTFQAIACAIPLFLVLLSVMHQSLKIKLSTFVVILALFITIALSSGFGLKYILYYGVCLSLFLISDLYKREKLFKYFYYLAIFFAIGSMINLLLPGVYRSLILPGFTTSSTYLRLVRWSNKKIAIIPGFANQTSFNACHFVYGIGYLLGKFMIQKELKPKEWIFLALFIVCLVLTNKRAHFLFAIISLTICYYFISDDKKRGNKLLIIVLVGTAFVLGLYYAIQYIDIGVLRKLNRMLIDLQNEEDVTSGRSELYRIAINQFKTHPIFGIGWEQFRTLPELGRTISTHNIYLELLCETGIVGTSVFLAFFIKALYNAIKVCRLGLQGGYGIAAYMCLYMQVFFLLYGITGNPLYDVPYFFPYFLICAFTFSLERLLVKAGKTGMI